MNNYNQIVEQVSITLRNKIEGHGHYLKVLEEASELSEVLVKCVTKRDKDKPPLEKVIEEMGDLHFRMHVLAHHLKIEDLVKDRMQEKADQLKEYIDSGEWNK